MEKKKILFRDECYRIVGACFNVYNEKGCAFHEPVYQECLEMEFGIQAIPTEPQKVFDLEYRGRRLSQSFRVDFLCYGAIIVEIKAVSKLADEHRAQVLNYLAASGCELGLLVNFGAFPKLEYERIVLTTKHANRTEPPIDLRTGMISN